MELNNLDDVDKLVDKLMALPITHILYPCGCSIIHLEYTHGDNCPKDHIIELCHLQNNDEAISIFNR